MTMVSTFSHVLSKRPSAESAPTCRIYGEEFPYICVPAEGVETIRVPSKRPSAFEHAWHALYGEEFQGSFIPSDRTTIIILYEDDNVTVLEVTDPAMELIGNIKCPFEIPKLFPLPLI